MLLMETLTILLAGWAPILYLSTALMASSWLNRHAAKAITASQALGWTALGSALLVLPLWWSLDTSALTVVINDKLPLGLRIDALSLALWVLITFLGAILLRFSARYLEGDKEQGHFVKWMLFTLGSILAVVLAPGLLQFWLALVSTSLGLHQLLIYFPDRLGTLLSARKKFFVSRIGDLCLLGAFGGLYTLYGTENFSALFASIENDSSPLAENTWIGWLIVIGAMLKSAQFPFHTWLPDTMGTPTPVSALMHAGIINIGGYLIVRLSPIWSYETYALHALALVGAWTALYGAYVMLTQTSIKRALAYSTIAQMGFMLLQCGLGAFHLAILHLIAHSLYKAHAFLSSGTSVNKIYTTGRNSLAANIPQESRSLGLLAFILIATGFSVALLMQVSESFSSKPGAWVFGTVLSLALAQWLWTTLPKSENSLQAGRAILFALSFAGLYLLLATGATALLQTVVPAPEAHNIGFEIALSLLLLVGLVGSMLLQSKITIAWIPETLRTRLYVHALNGFYLNTLANRISRKMGLVPHGR